MSILSIEFCVILTGVIDQWWALNMSLDDRNELTENDLVINHLVF